MDKTFFAAGSVLAGLAVAAGAFGAHALSDSLTTERQSTFETAVRYQMYHALALIAVSWAISRWAEDTELLNLGGWLFVAGIVLFSGSLYLLALTGVRWLGAVAPVGGVAFIAGWLALAIAVMRR
jgi:uncharacterized membrane protein YgdD (TMEM256/DUF423 family)